PPAPPTSDMTLLYYQTCHDSSATHRGRSTLRYPSVTSKQKLPIVLEGCSRRCWPMWRCRSSTSTSPRHPVVHGPPQSSGGLGARKVCPTIGYSGTRTYVEFD